MNAWLFAPLREKQVALFRAGFAAFAAWAFYSAGLKVRAEGFGGWDWALTPLYDLIFLHGWYWLVALVPLGLFGFGWRPRITGPVALMLLLPLGYLDQGVQSRHLMFAILACLALYPGRPLSAVFGRETSPWPPLPWWPTGLVVLLISMVYGFNAIAKASPEYLSGLVLEGLAETHPHVHIQFEDGICQVGPFPLPSWMLAGASTLTEAFLAVVVWQRSARGRWIAFLSVTGFHLLLTRVMTIFMLNITVIATLGLVYVFATPGSGGKTNFRRRLLSKGSLQ